MKQGHRSFSFLFLGLCSAVFQQVMSSLVTEQWGLLLTCSVQVTLGPRAVLPGLLLCGLLCYTHKDHIYLYIAVSGTGELRKRYLIILLNRHHNLFISMS